MSLSIKWELKFICPIKAIIWFFYETFFVSNISRLFSRILLKSYKDKISAAFLFSYLPNIFFRKDLIYEQLTNHKMPSCPNCSYKLVLLSSRPKYKCALCSKLYPEKEIEIREFLELNKRLKLKDIENYEKEKRESQIRISKIKKDLRLLFNGFPKVSKIGNAKPNYLNHLKRKYSKQSQKEYYEKNKDKISQLGKKWRLKHREYDLKRKQEYGKENRIIRNFKAKLRRQDNPEPERERKKAWRNNKLQIMRTYK